MGDGNDGEMMERRRTYAGVPIEEGEAHQDLHDSA